MTQAPSSNIRPNALWRAVLYISIDTRFAALILLLTAWAVYHPAINRLFAGDQIHYLAELKGDTSLSAGLQHWDYAITRQFWKGDDALFRPLLYVSMAVSNSLFGYQFRAWNVSNLLIHVFVGVMLFRLLRRIRPSPFALPAAVLFIVLTPSLELVLWNHLPGYLLAWAFFLAGAEAFVGLLRGDDAAVRFALAFGIAAFLYESMAVASLLAATIVLAVWRYRGALNWKRAALLLAPIVLFVALYAVHASRVERFNYVDRPEASDRLDIPRREEAVTLGAAVARQWMMEFALPLSEHFTTAPFVRFTKSVQRSWADGAFRLNVAVALASLLCLIGACSLAQLKRSRLLLLFFAATAAVYIAVIGSGRARSEILGVTYYTYFFGVLLSSLLYALVDFDRALRSRWLTYTAGLLLLAFVLLHGSRTYAIAQEVERANHFQAAYFDRIIEFVDEHKHEPDFSFAILPHPDILDPSIYLVEGYPDNPKARSERRLLSEIMFARYYNKADPKYLLDSSATRVVE